MEAPDCTAPLIGVREWRLLWRDRAHGTALASLITSHVWRRSEEAYCRHYRRAPHPECGCGLYAFYDWKLCNLFGAGLRENGIAGIVSATGDIELHEHGFRAERMKIEALLQWPDASWWQRRKYKGVAKRYHVPLLSLKEAETFAQELDGFWLGSQDFAANIALEKKPTLGVHGWSFVFATMLLNVLAGVSNVANSSWWVLLSAATAMWMLCVLMADQKKVRQNGEYRQAHKEG